MAGRVRLLLAAGTATIAAAAAALAASPAATADTTGAVRINAGGGARTVGGVAWSGCTSTTTCGGWVSGGFRYAKSPTPAISGVTPPADAAIYQTEWTGGQTSGIPAGAVAFRFSVPVSAGNYSVRLHFAENVQNAPGKRVFDVNLEGGAAELSGFDIFAAAGGMNKAIVREFPVTVNDGAVTIDFVRQIENAKISGIEVIPVPPPSRNAVRIDTGGTARSVGGVPWSGCSAATSCGGWVSGGFRYAKSPAPAITGVTAPADAALYQTEWTGGQTNGVPVGSVAFAFTVPVANGDYRVRLHFAENVQTAAGKRVFDVNLEGGPVELSGFDIFAAAGGQNRALVREFPVSVTDGAVSISFIRRVENAKISGIEILPVAAPDPDAPFTEITWSTGALSPIGRHEAFGGFAADGRLYVFGGYTGAPDFTPTRRADRYDPATNTWTRRRDLPIGLTHAGLAVDGRSIYIAGGYPQQADGTGQTFSTTAVWRYDIDSDTYTALPAMPLARGGGALVLHGRTLHVFGGADSARRDTATHYALDLDGGTAWRPLANLPIPRNHLGAVSLGSRVYAVAGQTGQDAKATYRAHVHAYDPATNTWTAVAPMPRPQSHNNASTFVLEGRILVIGGETSYGSSTKEVLAYDLAAGGWTALSPLPQSRNAGVAGAWGGQLFHVTGNTSRTTYEGTPVRPGPAAQSAQHDHATAHSH